MRPWAMRTSLQKAAPKQWCWTYAAPNQHVPAGNSEEIMQLAEIVGSLPQKDGCDFASVARYE